MQKAAGSTQDIYSWTLVKCPDSGARSHHASILFKHYIITSFGDSSFTSKDDIICFDINKSEWKKLVTRGKILENRSGHSMCLFYDNQILIYGGYYYQVLRSILRLTIDPNTLATWVDEVVPSSGVRGPYRTNHTAHSYNNSMYVLGGFDDQNNSSNELWRFSLENLTWKLCVTSGTAPNPRFHHCSALLEDKMYIFGGRSGPYSKATDNFLYILDMITMSWQSLITKGKVPAMRYGASIEAIEGNLVLFGGIIDKGDTNQLHLYKIKNNSWKLIKPLGAVPAPRSHHTSILAHNKLFIWGGNQGTERYSEIFCISLAKFLNEEPVSNVVKASQQNSALQKLYAEKLFTDVTFQVEDQEFTAHRNILAGGCRYFYNMFSSGMKEANADKIIISDIKADTFKAMLEFIYCNQVEADHALMLDLFSLSDKYSFSELKGSCEEFFSKHVNEGNFVELAIKSEQLEADVLKEAILTFIVNNIQKIRQRKDFMTLPKSILIPALSKLNKK